MDSMKVIGITPFEKPDVGLALALAKAKAFPVIHLGRDKEKAVKTLREMEQKCDQHFGVCFVAESLADISLPDQVTLVIAPYGFKPIVKENIHVFYQVHTVLEAKKAKEEGANGIIVKGNEGAGKVADESSFILFQRICKEIKDIDIWVQGGVGIHTAAGLAATGAKGVVLDSQLILFPECNAPKEIKHVCEKLLGNETKVVDKYRVLVRPNSPALPERPKKENLEKYLGTLELNTGYLPLGQDVALSMDLVQRYKKLKRLVFGIHEAMHGHLKQAKTLNVIKPGNALAEELAVSYPIAQGPMTRVSDVPQFAAAVATAGGLPFIALSLTKGEKARELMQATKKRVAGKTWGVGILGFAPQEIRDEQLAYIKQEKPPVVLIAGGRPSQAKPLEKIGIKTFLHVPTVSLLDMFLKEGAKRFVFEGRECGGHVGPLTSLVLWEKQTERLLLEDNADQFTIFFAGGIHDSLSAAFVSVMAAPLATKGAKIGVLMGTAYLYTKEAVETGAILKEYQNQAIEHTETVLLETAPGHETRCLNSPFVSVFNQEKEKLQAEGVDKKEVWTHLELLNVGRLRIAAKGIERKGDQLLSITAGEQVTTGMYMIGQVAALRNQVVSIIDLHKEVAQANYAHIQKAALPPLPKAEEKAFDVAIVGMACIFPDARNIDEYWRNIVLAKDCVTEVPDDRWNKELYYDSDSFNGDKSPSKWGGFIPKIDFDPVEFGIPPQSLAAIEPTQLLSLLVAKQALTDAGYGNNNFNRENVSVIIGAEGGNDLASNYGFRSLFKQVFGEMPPEVDEALPRLTEDSFPGILANVIAGRICNRLDLGGRNFTVDAACASSLAAIELACQELVSEKADMVLAGGADLHNGINDYLMFSSTHALSRKGRCMTFDAGADGIALGEGVAVIVLKRYEDAKRDGNKIYAVIKGVGGSSDGKSLGLTAPRKTGQVKALERAYEQAGVSPAELGLVEAHGTGTVVGDRTELSALTDLLIYYGATASQTHLGSVKTQIGHTKCAAGLAGLIKAALSVYHGVKPPTIHLKTPNGYYHQPTSPFTFDTQAGLWTEEYRLAGISAFGFGGTNFHAVIANDSPIEVQTPALKVWPSELFVFRGDTYEEVKALLQAVKAILQNNENIPVKDIAYSLSVYNTKPVQLSFVAENVGDIIAKIEQVVSGKEAKGVYFTKKLEGKVAFMFPGQGSQRLNMARDLFVVFPAMRKLLKDNKQYKKVLFPDIVFDEAALKKQADQMKDTSFAQPLLGIVDLAIASYLKVLGIEPDMVAGHSYGELPALCFANVFKEDYLVPLSEKRAAAILNSIAEDKGLMVAVNCPEEELTQIVSEEVGVYPVNHNSPHQWVLAGTTEAMKRLMERLKIAKISFKQLEVACAFHSPLLAKSKDLYKNILCEVPFTKASLPVWSNTTASIYPENPEEIKERLAEHLVRPVRFSEQVQQMYAQGARIFIEVGPGKVLTSLAKASLGKDELLLYTDGKDKNGITQLLSTLAQYIASGRDINLEKLFDGREASLLNLDNPQQYKKSPTLWLVNGQMAIPTNGKLPSHGAMPIRTPLKWKGNEMKTATTHKGDKEQVIEQYLDSIKSIVHAQRDVLLAYLGHSSDEVPGFEKQEVKSSKEIKRVEPAPEPAFVESKEEVDSRLHLSQSGLSRKDIKEILLQVVSDRTGYPQEMLGLDMDLEADLSIDSIKRMEIIGGVKDKLGGFTQGEVREEEVIEQLASIKTLNGLINWITEALSRSNVPAQETPKQAEQVAVNPDSIEKLARWRFELSPSILNYTKQLDLGINGQRFAITGTCEKTGLALKKVLEEKGAIADLVSANNSLSEYNGLLILDIFTSARRFDILDFFALVKKLDARKVRWVYVISDVEEYIGQSNDVKLLRNLQGYSGFLKSLQKEWEHAKCINISLSIQQSTEKIARIALDEILYGDSVPDVVYNKDGRQVFHLVPAMLTKEQPSHIQLGKESVVLVLGGAQGITAELMIQFSEQYPCHYILVGRSSYPNAESHQMFRHLGSKEEIKKYLLAQGGFTTPSEIEKKANEIFKGNQILATVSALEKHGAIVSYHSLDLRSEEKLSNFLADIYKEYGRIDGVVHGAGVLEDKLFQHKTSESFERVFSTKVTPLRVLAEELKAETQFVVLFSSVASVYGNRGQTDYSAANNVMDRYAWKLKEKIKGKVMAINWGPWRGAGMVSLALQKEYERRGISLIPLKAGVETFVNELNYGRESQILIMAEKISSMVDQSSLQPEFTH